MHESSDGTEFEFAERLAGGELREPSDSTVLIVDDRGSMRQTLRRRLQQEGYRVREAETGEDGLRVVAEEEVDLVLLDIGLPGMDGFGVLERLRETYGLSELSVVMLTGNESESDVLEALEKGANDYVTKDTDVQITLARIQTQLQLQHARERLVRLARTDDLTGMLNRRAFFDRLEDEHERFRRSRRPYGLLVVDIDKFKEFNDAYGHAFGDRMLREFARRIDNHTRSIDSIARVGGEEFIVLLPETDYGGAGTAARRVREVIAATPFSLEPEEVDVTASVGWTAQSAEDPVSPEELVELADAAMYDAKSDGRDCARGLRP